MTYALYNTAKKTFLEHPVVGVWLSSDLDEAKEMLKAAHAYVLGFGLEEFIPRIIIVDYETKEPINIESSASPSS